MLSFNKGKQVGNVIRPTLRFAMMPSGEYSSNRLNCRLALKNFRRCLRRGWISYCSFTIDECVNEMNLLESVFRSSFHNTTTSSWFVFMLWNLSSWAPVNYFTPSLTNHSLHALYAIAIIAWGGFLTEFNKRPFIDMRYHTYIYPQTKIVFLISYKF